THKYDWPECYAACSVSVHSPFSLLDRANTQKGLVGPQMAGVFVTTSSLTRVYKSVSMGCANGSSLVTVDSILPKSSEACFGSVGERRRLVSQFELASTR